jgi:DNA-binding transcriptional MerR regulator
VSSRTYLSIGDVLTLLREEFPDVTISKIRFLESQGLVNPERSPSGYRKFFDHDVERLRWVLRQQREHFLPLKVIRDRLADGELDDEPGDRANGKTAEPGGAHVATAASPDDEQPTKADEEAMARIVADASRRTARMPEAAQARRGLQVVTEHSAPDVAQPPVAAASASASGPRHARDAVAAAPAAVDAGVVAAAGADGGGGVQARRDAAPPQDDAASGGRRASEPTTETPARGPAHPPAAATPPAPAPASRPAPPVTPGVAAAAVAATTTSMVTGASLTAQELAAASGLSLDEVEGLEGFGLICSVRVAGMQTYDEEALAVANLAAAFRAFGIEPRHLRLYRNAVDREMGLIEQVVIPLLRQRNPESRQRAAEGADQLAALGQSMRASLLRQALRQHLGG